MTDELIDKKLDSIVRLFCCLNGRGQFIATYTERLAQRLLNKTTCSDKAEEQMINKLQVQCGHNTVNKIKTMFQDMIKSKNVMEEFIQKQGGNKNIGGIEFNVEILTSGHWPYQAPADYRIPPQFQRGRDTFTNFYGQKFANRTLIWLYNHGSITVQTTYTSKPYYFVINCPQATILSLFNECDVLTKKQVMERTSLNEQDFKDAMMKFCHPKYRVLLKENMKKPEFKDDEKIKVNADFKNDIIKIKLVPQIKADKLMEGAGGNRGVAEVEAQVVQQRCQIIDATCVRIMKARKVETQNNLTNEIIRQIQMFQAQPQMIKQRFDHLIEREYIERDPDDRTKFRYLP